MTTKTWKQILCIGLVCCVAVMVVPANHVPDAAYYCYQDDGYQVITSRDKHPLEPDED